MRSFFCLVLAILSLASVEVEPPEVPNPYNTSEARALRDHLAETFHVKAGVRTDLEALRRLYHKAWNDQQAQLLLDGKEGDPRYRAAIGQEERNGLLAQLQELGGIAGPAASSDEIKGLIAARRKEREVVADTDRRKRLSEERERAIAAVEAQIPVVAPQAPVRTGEGDRLELVPVAVGAPLRSAQDIIRTMLVARIHPNMTAIEKADMEETVRKLVAGRNGLAPAGYRLDFNHPLGIECWSKTQLDRRDKEKMQVLIVVFNPSEKYLRIKSVSFAFMGSARNPASADETVWGPNAMVAPYDDHTISSHIYYQDPGQDTLVSNVTIYETPERTRHSREESRLGK